MAATLDPDAVLRSSKGRDNFQRIARLLISGGTVLLREVFDIRCPPSNLPTILQNSATKKLLKVAKLTKPQWDCLYPSPGVYGKSTDFDITLLFRLLRTICSLTPPSVGWDCLPASTDQSFGADLARIKYYRNSIYGHVNENMEIADEEFLVLWREISEALVRIAGQIGSAKIMEWQKAIEKLLKDPLTEEDKRHEQELLHWYQNDTEVKEFMEKLDSSMKHLEKKVEETKGELRQEVRDEARGIRDQLGGKVESTAQEVQRLGRDVREEAQGIKEQLGGQVTTMTQEVQRLSQELRSQPNSLAGVTLRMRIDCETNSDLYPMAIPAPCTQAGGQELVISGITKETAQGSQGTQADDQGVVVTGITGRTTPNTQYTEAGNQEMLVTGVKRKAVEPIASAGLSQVATTEGSEVAKFGSDGTPSSQGVLNFIAHKYFQTVDTTKPEELNGFLQYLRDVRKVLVLDAQSGSLILTVQCSSLEILDALWDDYCTGYLNAMAQKFLVPEEVLKAFDLTELKLSTTIAEGDYRTARECFLQGSGGVMQIFVKNSTGYTVSLKVKSSDSIETVKQMVQIQGELFPQGELRLIFRGRELEDHLTIGAYGIRRNSTLHLRYEYNLDRILVNVELPYGPKICFDSSPCDDIEKLKKRIYEETGTPVTLQHLSLVGKEVLEDHQLLSEFDNQTELTLRLHEKQCISEFLLFVVTLSGKTKIALNAVLSDTVIDIKRKITNEIGIPADHQQLLLNDQFLADENTLASYYITRDSIIVLDVRKYHSNDMYVFVKAQNGIKWRVEVLAGDTIKNLKKRIKNQIGIPVNEQLIMFGDYELEGEHTLRDYGIQSGSTLFMVTNPETHKKCIVS